ncbi:MAG: aminoacetone oxidase family FAD-binding enzyme, partial [Dorea sp.]|nr:aminoacetone oxidase family FAD-binding enzyme [Dorea sp.]
MSKVLIVGGGAAGMFASLAAAESGHEVLVFEKNEKLGKKLFITGKGRCNLTNACDMEQLFRAVISNSKFLYSSFYGFTNQDAIAYFESLGLRTKIERGERVFPVSDHSSDVIRALSERMHFLGVQVFLNTTVKEIVEKEGVFHSVVLEDGRNVHGDACIIATGGLSYPSTGSTGDGFRFAEALGHQITECMPSLVPMETKEPWVKE